MLLIEVMIERLKADFPSLEFKVDEKNKSVTIPSKVEEIDSILIEEEFDEELIVHIGDFTHWHVYSCNKRFNKSEKANEIAESASLFLEQLFDDKIVFWKGKRCGGFYKLGNKPNSKSWFGKQHVEWVWSGQKHS